MVARSRREEKPFASPSLRFISNQLLRCRVSVRCDYRRANVKKDGVMGYLEAPPRLLSSLHPSEQPILRQAIKEAEAALSISAPKVKHPSAGE